MVTMFARGVLLDGLLTQLNLVNSLTPMRVPAGTKIIHFGRYVLNFYVGIVQYIICETKTWHTTIYLTTQHTNW
jgi:hypothetical protein